MLILDLKVISFHPVVVVGLGNDLLFNFIVGHCVRLRKKVKVTQSFYIISTTYVVICTYSNFGEIKT